MLKLPSLATAGLALAVAFLPLPASAQENAVPEPRWSLAIHGGAGIMDRATLTPELQEEFKAALQVALDAGAKVLRDGGSALDAVTTVITILEDDPKFNAGRGAVYTWEGTNELDASIMDGRNRAAGAVAGVTTVRHPILLARAVMDDARHVMLSGKGAEQFAAEQGLEIVAPDYFETEARKKALERMKTSNLSALEVEFKYGTVGAVARDSAGHLAAGTSTGGMTGKRWGRIGDAPIIGAGTYADDRGCAVSATGAGEYFIRVGVAHAICARLRAARELALDEFPEGESGARQDGVAKVPLSTEIVQGVADAVIAEVGELGGDGGVIVVSSSGDPVFSMNTPGMYRGRATSEGIDEVAIFAEE